MSSVPDPAKRMPSQNFIVITTTESETYPLTLNLQAKVESGTLSLKYDLDNRGSATLAIFNRIATRLPNRDLMWNPNDAYFSLIENHILHIQQQVLPEARDLPGIAEGFPTPHKSRLGSHSISQSVLTYTLPIPLDHPHDKIRVEGRNDKMIAKAQKPRLVNEVWFSLGVSKVSDKDIAEVADAPGIFGSVTMWVQQGQFVLTAKVKLPEPIPVLDYELVPR